MKGPPMTRILTSTLALGIAGAWLVLWCGVALAPLTPLSGPSYQYAMDKVWPSNAGWARLAIHAEAKGHPWLDATLLLAMCDVEDEQRRPWKRGTVGEIGVCQIRLGTWDGDKYQCIGLPWNPADNYRCAARILRDRIKACGTVSRAIASYNEGTNACPTPKRSRHVRKVLDLEMLRRFEG